MTATTLFAGVPPDRDEFILSQSVSYSPKHWLDRLPNDEQWPRALDDMQASGRWPQIDRRGVFSFAPPADAICAVHLYVAASVWGTGLKARNVARRVRALTENPAPGDRLLSAINVLYRDGPVPAYEALAEGGSDHLAHLGPSFLTKILYFAGWDRSKGDRQPLILDKFVVLALNDLEGLDWREAGWTAEQYDRYLDLAHGWASRWGTAPDVVERTLFQHGKGLASG